MSPARSWRAAGQIESCWLHKLLASLLQTCLASAWLCKHFDFLRFEVYRSRSTNLGFGQRYSLQRRFLVSRQVWASRGHFWGRFPPPAQGHGHRCQLLEKAASPDATVQCVYVHRHQLWPQLNVKAFKRRRIQLGLIDLSKQKKNPLECSFKIY